MADASQLTVNCVALTLTFVTALTGNEPPLNAVMMLWVNLIMDTMVRSRPCRTPDTTQFAAVATYRSNFAPVTYHSLACPTLSHSSLYRI